MTCNNVFKGARIYRKCILSKKNPISLFLTKLYRDASKNTEMIYSDECCMLITLFIYKKRRMFQYILSTPVPVVNLIVSYFVYSFIWFKLWICRKMSHTILLVQPGVAQNTRTYTDFETINDCLEVKYTGIYLKKYR